MESMAQERDALDSPALSIDKRLRSDAVESPLVDDATQPKEGADGYPVKVRKPYTITKQREKWTEEEHGKFLEALKLYGRSWRQIQEHIGTKTAVQIRSHAQKFFSKVVREPGASNSIEIPPPRPKRKPLHPYPRKCADSTVTNAPMGEPKNAPVSSPSGSDQENGSPVSVLSAMQSDAFGSSISNPSTGGTSPASSDDGNNVPEIVNGEENLLTQQIEDRSHQESKQDNSDGELSEEDSSRVQETSLKLFGKTVIIPDPKKVCSSDGGAGDDTQEVMQTSWVGGGVAAYPAHNGWFLPFHSFPAHMYESGDARISPLHMWWPYYGFPAGHPRGFGTGLLNEGTIESDADNSPSVETNSDRTGNVHVQTTTPTIHNNAVKESVGPVEMPESGPSVELKPSANSAFVRVKPSSSVSGDQSLVRGFVPYKRCKVE